MIKRLYRSVNTNEITQIRLFYSHTYLQKHILKDIQIETSYTKIREKQIKNTYNSFLFPF